MSIFKGTTEPKKIYLGNNELKAVYLGENKVRPTYKPRTFTISRTEQSNMSSGWTYSDDAAGLTAGDTAFDEFFGYSAVLLDANGSEVEEVTQSSPGVLNMGSFNGALTGTANNVMIKFPRRGIKMSKSGSVVTLSITEEPNKDGYQYYAHTKGTAAKDNLYIGAYEGTFTTNNSTVSSYSAGSTYLKSRATNSYKQTQSPASYRTIAEFRATAAKYGNGYSLITRYPRQYINALYMMKYGNPYSIGVVGYGYQYSSSSGAAPGSLNSQASATYGNTSGKGYAMKLFGLENIWGNVTEKIDGCFITSSNHLTVDKTNNIFQSSAYATDLGTIVGTYLGGISGTNDGMFYNVSNAGGKRYYYRAMYNMISGYDSIGAGGNSGSSTGIFEINSTDTYSNIGSRIMFL